MSNYTQARRLMAVTTPLGENALLLVGLDGREALSELFCFRLDLLAENATAVPFDRLVGQPTSVALHAPGCSTRHVCGILRSLRQGRRDGTFTHYQAELVPHFWLWSKRVQCRVFQELSVPDILKQVLDGLDVSWKLGGRYEPRNYTVQYRESDFAFASRLMEDEGIYYSFEHEGGKDRLVLADASPRSPELPPPNPVAYDETSGGVLPPARVTRWEKRQELRAGKYTLWDHSFQLPGQHLGAEEALAQEATAGQVSHRLQLGGNRELEIFDYPGGYAHRFDGIARGGGDRRGDMHKVFEDNARTARIRMEEEAAPGLTAEGDSTCGHFLPGYRFGLQRHYDGDGSYVLTQVEHKARIVGDYGRGEGLSLEHSNRFACLPLAVPYRPQRRTPRPTVAGPQTATVVGSPGSVSFNTQSYGPVGPAGDEIFCDKYGRVKVQFHWDRRSEYDEGSSCWLRVAQPWAGQQWGAVTLPRVGQEVVVAFEEGDPDRPLVMGSVYNAAQLPPFPLPAAKTQAGIKAHSQGSGANSQTFSGLGFETAMGQEHVHLHAERYMTHSAEHNLYVNAGLEHHTNVGSVSSRQVGGLPGVNHSLSIGKGPKSSPPPPPPPPPGGNSSGTGTGNPWFSPGPFYWSPDVLGAWASDLDAVVGWRQCNTAGLYSTTTVGQYNGTTINPLGVLMAFGAPFEASWAPLSQLILGVIGGALGVAGGMITGVATQSSGKEIGYDIGVGALIGASLLGPAGMAANINAFFGGNIGLQMGPVFTAQHGAKIDRSTPLKTEPGAAVYPPGPPPLGPGVAGPVPPPVAAIGNLAEAHPLDWPQQIVIGLASLLYATLSVGDIVLPALFPAAAKSKEGQIQVLLGAIGATNLALNLWVLLENNQAGITTVADATANGLRAAPGAIVQGAQDAGQWVADRVVQFLYWLIIGNMGFPGG